MSPQAHRALSCPDILYTVLEHFQGSPASWYDFDPATNYANAWRTRDTDVADARTLARCARVSRTFFYPAVALLWRNVDDLSGLLTLLGTISLASEEPHGGLIRLPAKQIQQLAYLPEQASRALCYAQHVRTVCGSVKAVDGGNRVPSWIKTQTLLPQLSHLRWVQRVSDSTDLLQLISPSLRSLHIIFKQPLPHSGGSGTCHSPLAHEAFVRDLVQQIPEKAPNLSYLRITTSGEAKESWFESVGEMRALETFDMLEHTYGKVTTQPLLRPLAVLPGLQHLKLRLSEAALPCFESGAFPSLRTLTLDAMFAPLCSVPAFLSSISSPHLETIALLHCECATSSVHDNLHSVTEFLRSKFACTLREFTLSLRGIGPEQSAPQPLIKTIEPLLAVRGLVGVRLAIAPEVAVVAASVDDLKTMCAAWPKVARLHLAYFPSSAITPLRDLALVSRQCPDLTDLTLPGIDASAADVDDILCVSAEAAAAVALEGLRTFKLADAGWSSRIPEARRLARCLDALFPGVDWNSPPLISAAWSETVQELVQLRIARLLAAKSSGRA